MSPEVLFGIIFAGFVVLFFVSKLLPKRQPKEKHFKCSRCGAVSPHTERTIDAWRKNRTKFFCQTCHAKWLQSRQPQKRDQFSSRSTTGSGCLGVVVLFLFVLLEGYLLVRTYT